jgi:C1A family cysteine protease
MSLGNMLKLTIFIFSHFIILVNSQKSMHPINMILNNHMDSSPAELFKIWHFLNGREYYILSLEGLKRYENFKKNLEIVKSHNSNRKSSNTYTLGLNNFADMALEEFHEQYLKGNQKIFRNIRENYYADKSKFEKLDFWELPEELDDEYFELFLGDKRGKVEKQNKYNTLLSSKFNGFKSIDWIEKANLNSYVENQGNCGSCWAFATAQAIEAAYYLKYGKSVRLSKQQLVDCENNSKGCSGGMLHTAMDYIKEKGIESEYEYPYAMIENNYCSYSDEKVVTKLDSYEFCAEDDCATDENLYMALEKGPVAAAVDGSEHFMLYMGGVFDKPCEELNHAILLVGYHRKKNELDDNYWVVKNSWGEKWGENGFIKIKHSKDYNNCLMNTYFVKPNL